MTKFKTNPAKKHKHAFAEYRHIRVTRGISQEQVSKFLADKKAIKRFKENPYINSLPKQKRDKVFNLVSQIEKEEDEFKKIKLWNKILAIEGISSLAVMGVLMAKCPVPHPVLDPAILGFIGGSLTTTGIVRQELKARKKAIELEKKELKRLTR